MTERVGFTEVLIDSTRRVKRIPQSEYLASGKIPVIDQGQEFCAGYCADFNDAFESVPAIVFGDHTRCVKYVDQPFVAGADGVKVLLCKRKEDNPKYFYYALKAANVPNLGYSRHFKLVKALTFADATRERQEAIIARLDSLEQLIVERQAEIDGLDELVKSRFVEMFGSEDWPKSTIGELSSDIRYGTSKKAADEGEFIYLRMNNLTDDGCIDLSDIKRITLGSDELDKCLVVKGDLLFNRTNSREKVGKTAVFIFDEPMVIAGYIIRVRLNPQIRSSFLSAFMNLASTKMMLRNMAKGAVNQANINSKELASIEVPVPPVELQDAFLSFASQVDKSRFAVQQAIEQLELLKASLMQEYFG